MTLRRKIEEEIQETGPVPFSRYMELCLYDPGRGYYSSHAEQFGKAGDFYTASDVHAVFGRLLARQFDEIWRLLGSPRQVELLELGPGRGLFAQDVLDWSEKKFPLFFAALHYTLAERSPALRAKLQQTLNGRFVSGKVSLLPEILELPGKGATAVLPPEAVSLRTLALEVPLIVFANEFFDALPVEVLGPQGALRITALGGRFVEVWENPSAYEQEFLDGYGVHPEEGERIEAPLIAHSYAAAIAKSMERGLAVIVDYGYTRGEQVAGRYRGTITAVRQHTVNADPYQAPGEQDITAHVNFTALADALAQNGMQVQSLLTQSQFLMGIGEENQFADAFADCRLPQERAKVALQLKHLVTPAGMGENFHVLIASKGVDQEKITALSGLSFARSPEPKA